MGLEMSYSGVQDNETMNENKANNNPENLLYFKTNGEHLTFHNKVKQFGFTNPIKREIEFRKIINIMGMRLWKPL